MAKLIKLSSHSWQQNFKDGKKQFKLWKIHPEVADFCKLEDGTKRLLHIEFENSKINETQFFQITSGKEIYFHKNFRDKIEPLILSNPDSFFIVTVDDSKMLT
jgi:putative restriction endonuclease